MTSTNTDRSGLFAPGDLSFAIAQAFEGITTDLLVTPEQIESVVPLEAIHPQRSTALYRLYGNAGQLLYVGMSEAPQTRLDAHAKTKPWWSDVARAAVEWHGTRFHASIAEILAIRTGRPVHNVHHALGSRMRVHSHVREELDAISRTTTPVATLLERLASRRMSHHAREVLVIAYLTRAIDLPITLITRSRNSCGPNTKLEIPMSYRTRVTGEFTIAPPLSWREIKDSAFISPQRDASDLVLRVEETAVDTDDGQLVRKVASVLEMREIDEYNSRNLLAEVQKAVDSFPGREWSGRLNCEGEESADLWRVVIRDGRAVKVEPAIVWPEDSE